MNINFPLILVIGSAVTGIIWLLDKVLFEHKRKADYSDNAKQAVEKKSSQGEYKEPVFVEISKFLFPVFIVVLVLRSFIVEPFRIPSGSMIPTLEIGDFILVNKFTYGLRLPISNTKIVSFNTPERGDVAVFRYPVDKRIDYIKRVIGLPGDEISYHNKRLYINGDQIEVKEMARLFVANNEVVEYQEKLDTIHHKIRLTTGYNHRGDETFLVPEGHYFVMGDNRDNSSDSRVWGFVPEENLVGKAFVIWMNMSFEPLDWPKWDRIGTIIE